MTAIDIEQKLSKLHALHAGAKTEGERRSVINAKRRILEKIISLENNSVEYKFSLKNRQNVELFINILNRYNINDYRMASKAQTTIIAKVPGVFVDNILWPEYLDTPRIYS